MSTYPSSVLTAKGSRLTRAAIRHVVHIGGLVVVQSLALFLSAGRLDRLENCGSHGQRVNSRLAPGVR